MLLRMTVLAKNFTLCNLGPKSGRCIFANADTYVENLLVGIEMVKIKCCSALTIPTSSTTNFYLVRCNFTTSLRVSLSR